VLSRLKTMLPEWKEKWKEEAKKELSCRIEGDYLGRAAMCKEVINAITTFEELASDMIFVDD